MNDHIWHAEPASAWHDGMPIGNGVLAAMVLGGVETERLALNHEWLWRGRYRNRDVPDVADKLDGIRKLFFEGKNIEAGELAVETLSGKADPETNKHSCVDPYQPAGDLFITIDGAESGDYRRELDMREGAVTVTHGHASGATIRRRAFAHATQPIIVCRIDADPKQPLAGTLSLGRTDDPACRSRTFGNCEQGTGLLGFHGDFGDENVAFEVRAHVRFTGTTGLSQTSAKDATLQFDGATQLLIVLTIAVNTDGDDPEAQCAKQLDDALVGLSSDVDTAWETLCAGHVATWSSQFDRVQLDLGDDRSHVATGRRQAAVKAGEADEGLIATYFNFARYLLMASTLQGTLPPNLQGKWNQDIAPPWDCDLHEDVNLQMNFWAAEVCGQVESTETLFAHMERFLPHAREVARKLYGCRGIHMPIQTDPWGRATPQSACWDVWIGAAAWLAQHMWWRWEYGLDPAFLRDRAYPYIKEVAAFYETYLVPDPRDPEKRLVPVPSQSPENYFVGGILPVSLCVAAAMDLELIQEVLTHAIEASEVLGIDDDKRDEWRDMLDRLMPLKIGRHGQLQEWGEDYEEAEPDHRHVSHLYALFPGDGITLEDTPELAQAARVSLERRLEAGAGQTGWSGAWSACLWARLREGDRSYDHLRTLVGESSTASLLDLYLLTRGGPVFQIEGNFGGAAGIAEMLMQSHGGCIRILPALPSAWRDGSVKGLHTRGGFTIDIAWQDARPTTVVLRSRHGEPCRLVLANARQYNVCDAGGRPVEADTDAADDLIAFGTDPGGEYTITPTG